MMEKLSELKRKKGGQMVLPQKLAKFKASKSPPQKVTNTQVLSLLI
jgi:hypothetical protein